MPSHYEDAVAAHARAAAYLEEVRQRFAGRPSILGRVAENNALEVVEEARRRVEELAQQAAQAAEPAAQRTAWWDRLKGDD